MKGQSNNASADTKILEDKSTDIEIVVDQLYRTPLVENTYNNNVLYAAGTSSDGYPSVQDTTGNQDEERNEISYSYEFSDHDEVSVTVVNTRSLEGLEIAKPTDVEHVELFETAENGNSYNVGSSVSSEPTVDCRTGGLNFVGCHIGRSEPTIKLDNPVEFNKYIKDVYDSNDYENHGFSSDTGINENFDGCISNKVSHGSEKQRNAGIFPHFRFPHTSPYSKNDYNHYCKHVSKYSSQISRARYKRDKEPVVLEVKTLEKLHDLEKVKEIEQRKPNVSTFLNDNKIIISRIAFDDGMGVADLPTRPHSAKTEFINTSTKYLARTSSAPSRVRPTRLMCKVAPIKDAHTNPEYTKEQPKEDYIDIEQLTRCVYHNLDDKNTLTKRVRSFYKKQNTLIEAIQEDTGNKPQRVNNIQNKTSLYAKVSFFANLLLFIAKTTAAVVSGSMAIISSLVDSVVDLVSGVVIWLTARAVKRADFLKYPDGKKRLEPLGVIILSVIMGIASLQLVKESVQKMIGLANFTQEPPTVALPTIVISVVTIVTKFGLYVMCRKVESPTVKALAQDHRNDVLSNTLAIICGYIGSQEVQDKFKLGYLVHVDPIGAIIISLYIVVTWYVTGKENAKILAGKSAKPETINKLTWIILNHHKDISHIQVIKVFYSGYHYHVEACIELPADTTLSKASDISSSLERNLKTSSKLTMLLFVRDITDRNFKSDGCVQQVMDLRVHLETWSY